MVASVRQVPAGGGVGFGDDNLPLHKRKLAHENYEKG
jgi:hypothetical protein